MNEQYPAIDALSTAVAETTEEAVINALCTAHSIDGRDGHRLEALPLDATPAILQRYRFDVSTSPNYPSIARS
jgi:D-aminopeptidase